MRILGWFSSSRDDRSKKQKDKGKNEGIAQQWTSLETLWHTCEESAKDTALAQEVKALFPANEENRTNSGPSDWARLNMAEQRVALCLSEPQLDVEYRALDQIAITHEVKTVRPEADYLVAGEKISDEAKRKAFKLAMYLSTLHTLQKGFVEKRVRRKLRLETANRLLCQGAAVVLLAVLPLAIYFAVLWLNGGIKDIYRADPAGNILLSTPPLFILATVAAFGILGAYFSRVLAFHNNLDRFDFNEFIKNYASRMLLLRMLYGMIGALVFYHILRAGLIGGDMFPDLGKLSFIEQHIWKAGPDGKLLSDGATGLQPSGLTLLMPTADMAKLLVWSFLAGFSERLVRDNLSSLEAKGISQG